VDGLISQGLVIARGVKTKEKWYIQEVQLPPGGRARAKKLLNRQQQLPLRSTRVSHAISDKKF
jgi:hypothetical protein